MKWVTSTVITKDCGVSRSGNTGETDLSTRCTCSLSPLSYRKGDSREIFHYLPSAKAVPLGLRVAYILLYAFVANDFYNDVDLLQEMFQRAGMESNTRLQIRYGIENSSRVGINYLPN